MRGAHPAHLGPNLRQLPVVEPCRLLEQERQSYVETLGAVKKIRDISHLQIKIDRLYISRITRDRTVLSLYLTSQRKHAPRSFFFPDIIDMRRD